MRLFNLTLILTIIVSLSSCTKKQLKKETALQPEPPQTQQELLRSTSTQTELKPEFGNLPIPPDEESDEEQKLSFSLKTVYFDFDKYELTPQARDILSENAKTIIENNLRIIIEGHCDERGTQQYNLSLGQKRADAVKDYYIRLGVDPTRIATISYGEEMPVCTEKTEECWALNRRAETKVVE